MIDAARLPSSWKLVPLRRVLRKLDRPVSGGSGIVTAYRDGRVTLRSIKRDEGYTLSDLEAGYQGVKKGDLVFHALDGFAGAVGVSDADGRCTPVYHVCTATGGDDVRFIAYCLRAMGWADFLTVQAGNVRQRSVDFRPWEAFGRIPFPRPPVTLQSALADFLDKETARLDALIQKKRRMVALLEQQFLATVAQAMGASRLQGESWEATIAARWPTAQLRRHARIVNGGTPTADEENWGGNVVWVTPEDLSDEAFEIGVSKRTITAKGLAMSSATLVPEGAIVLSTRAPIGSVGIAKVPLSFNQGCRAVVPSPSLDSWFLLFQVLLARSYLNSIGSGTTFKELSASALASARIAVPPLREQIEIREKLLAVSQNSDRVKLRLERQIGLLREHRKAMITSAVTGQLDMAKAAA